MALDAAKNFAKARLSTGYNSAATTIVLATGGGAKFPAQPFNAVWWDATLYLDPSDDPNVEIVRVTGLSTDTLTVTRAQESTVAANHNTAAHTYMLAAGPTAKLVTDLGSITDDTTTNAAMYPMWVTAATGNLPQYVSSTKLAWNPSTGSLSLGGNVQVSGNVGIGTTAPKNRLESRGSGNMDTLANAYANAAIFASYFSNDIYGIFIGASNSLGVIQVAESSTVADPLALNPYGGNVGIGTTAPTSPLQVVTLPTYTTNAAALAGGLTAGAFFKVNVSGEYFVHVVV